MDKIKFNLAGVDYTFDRNKNLKISNFNMFIRPFSLGEWESNTFSVFNHVKDNSKIAIDIGAWIGPTAIWLSKNFNKVLAIEGDIVAAEALKENLKDSDCNNVDIVEKVLYSDNSKVTFGANQYVPIYREEGLGASTSQIKTDGFIDTDYVSDTITVNDLSNMVSFKDVGFVKLDIEGGEENILNDIIKHAEENHWKMWISFHYHWWKDLNINRFSGLFDNAKIAAYNSYDRIIPNNQILNCIMADPFGSIYFEF